MNIELQQIIETIKDEMQRVILFQHIEDAAPDPPDFEDRLETFSRSNRIRLFKRLQEDPEEGEDEKKIDFDLEKIRHVGKIFRSVSQILADHTGDDLETLESVEAPIVEFPFKTTEGRGLEDCATRLRKIFSADREFSLVSRADARKAHLAIMASVRELEMTFPILTSKNPGTKRRRYHFVIRSRIAIHDCKYKIPRPLSVQLWGWLWLELKLRCIFILRRMKKRLSGFS